MAVRRASPARASGRMMSRPERLSRRSSSQQTPTGSPNRNCSSALSTCAVTNGERRVRQGIDLLGGHLLRATENTIRHASKKKQS